MPAKDLNKSKVQVNQPTNKKKQTPLIKVNKSELKWYSNNNKTHAKHEKTQQSKLRIAVSQAWYKYFTAYEFNKTKEISKRYKKPKPNKYIQKDFHKIGSKINHY